MTKNNDRRKHWRFGRIYEKEQAQLWNVLRKAWENFGATVLAKTVAPGKEKEVFVLCSRPRQNVKLGTLTL